MICFNGNKGAQLVLTWKMMMNVPWVLKEILGSFAIIICWNVWKSLRMFGNLYQSL